MPLPPALPVASALHRVSGAAGPAGALRRGAGPAAARPTARADASRTVPLGRARSAGVSVAALRVGILGAAVLLLAYARPPVSLRVHAFWFALLLAIALLGGLAWGRPRAAVIAAEAVLALVAVQGLWSVATPGARPPGARLGEEYGVSWRLTFAGPQQALMKTLPLPNEWEG